MEKLEKIFFIILIIGLAFLFGLAIGINYPRLEDKEKLIIKYHDKLYQFVEVKKDYKPITRKVNSK